MPSRRPRSLTTRASKPSLLRAARQIVEPRHHHAREAVAVYSRRVVGLETEIEGRQRRHCPRAAHESRRAVPEDRLGEAGCEPRPDLAAIAS